MSSKTELSRQALRGALAIRTKAGIPHDRPICVYDVAEKLGVEVQFFAADSFNGAYSKTSSVVMVPSLRPYGRQAFSCGHELGHWHFGHGTRFEMLDGHLTDESDPEEFLADTFAGHLLMPPWALDRALARRALVVSRATPLDIYGLACQFGVGYESIVTHLAFSCKRLRDRERDALISVTPKMIREKLIGRRDGVRHLTIVDRAWESMPIDLQVGDCALISGSVELTGTSARFSADVGQNALVVAERPGISTVSSKDGAWSAFVRVSKKDFSGRAIYRHLEDPDVD